MTKDRRIGRLLDKRLSGKRLGEIRGARHITQRELAEGSGVAVQKVRNIEHGLVLADDSSLGGFAKVLGVLPSSLRVIDLGGKDQSWTRDVRALFKISKTLDFSPISTDEFAGLLPKTDIGQGLCEVIFGEWRRVADEVEGTDARRVREVLTRHLLWRSSDLGEVAQISRAWRSPESEISEYGDNIKRLRAARGLSQRELAERVGENPRSIKAYESGAWTPKESVNDALAGALGVRSEALLAFGVTEPAQAIQTLLDVAEVFYLRPDVTDAGFVLRTQSRDLEKALDSMAAAWARGEEARQGWYDTYDDSHARWVRKSRYASRFTWEDFEGQKQVSYADVDEWRGRLFGA